MRVEGTPEHRLDIIIILKMNAPDRSVIFYLHRTPSYFDLVIHVHCFRISFWHLDPRVQFAASPFASCYSLSVFESLNLPATSPPADLNPANARRDFHSWSLTEQPRKSSAVEMTVQRNRRMAHASPKVIIMLRILPSTCLSRQLIL